MTKALIASHGISGSSMFGSCQLYLLPPSSPHHLYYQCHCHHCFAIRDWTSSLYKLGKKFTLSWLWGPLLIFNYIWLFCSTSSALLEPWHWILPLQQWSCHHNICVYHLKLNPPFFLNLSWHFFSRLYLEDFVSYSFCLFLCGPTWNDLCVIPPAFVWDQGCVLIACLLQFQQGEKLWTDG